MALQSKYLVLNLALKDLKHEWILTTCLIMAISAVLAPLLLLFGLKYGIINEITRHLVNDPRYREIRPNISKSFNNEWFSMLNGRDDVSFVIPMTREISATVKVQIKGQRKKQEFNLVPTNAGDPLLLENGASIPAMDECVVTRFAAVSLGIHKGDTLVASAGRIIHGKYEYGTLELKVAGILAERASQQKSLYVRLPVLEAVEHYKDGLAVPEYGWSGSIPKAYPLFDGVIIVLPDKLTRIQELSLCSNTGFTKIESLDPEALKTRAGFQVGAGKTVYRLYTQYKPAGMESIKSVRNKLRGKDALVLPWVAPLSAKLKVGDHSELVDINLYGLSVDNATAESAGIVPIPPWGEQGMDKAGLLQVMLPPGLKVTGDRFSIQVNNQGKLLKFPVTVVEKRTDLPGVSFVPEKLAGIIRLHHMRNVAFDENVREFVLFRKGYASFRLYANSIYDVGRLRNFFDSKAIPVHTELIAINQVIQMDKGMNLIFWLLAVVGTLGSIASLVASLYASVERKKRELSVLRLIGLPSKTLFRFPVYQGVFFAVGGFLTSMVLFSLFSRLINIWFAPYAKELLGYLMKANVNLCHIPPGYIAAAFALTVCVAAVSAMVAALKVSRIEPAEALRDE